MRTKVYYIISDIEKALAFEWIAEGLDKQVFDLCFILLGKINTPLITFLRSKKVALHVVPFNAKKDLLRCWWTVFKILRSEKPDVVHTHLWIANLVGQTASWMAGIKKRIFTRHHATIHYREYPSGRKWDMLLNFLATDIVAISESIREILVSWDKADAKKIHLIHHGFDWRQFENVGPQRVDALRRKYNIDLDKHPVVGVIARYTHWKGIQYIIPAFKRIRMTYPDAILILANARGDYAREIKMMLSELPGNTYTEIEFEEDLGALYQLFDVYVHAPIDRYAEAFGQTYVEALLSGVPSVFTLSGVASEFIVDKVNALVVKFENNDDIYSAIIETLEDTEQTNQRVMQGRASLQSFQLEYYLRKLERLYLSR